MKSLFNQNHSSEIIARVNSLTHTSQSQWGKMNVSQMLTHCQRPLQAAHGEIKLKRGLIGILFGGMIKKKLTKDETPFDKDLPTDKNFIIVDQREFDKEKEKLIGILHKFQKGGEAAITKEPHSFFGKMTANEWDIIQWKHMDHHLRQFGA